MKKNILLVNDTSLVCHHGCSLLMQCIYDLFKKNQIIIKDRIYFEENCTKYLKNEINFDLILINGEGTIHGNKNSDSNKVNEIFEFIKSIKKNHDIPVIIFNSTISSLKKDQIQVLKIVDKIYVRESYSYDYLKKNKIKSMIVPDLLSLLELKNKKGGNQIIVNDSSVASNTLKLKKFSELENYNYIPILYNNYLRYLRYFICKILPIKELKFITKLYLITKNKYVLTFLNKINKSKFIITGRFHAIFIALAYMRPFYTFESDTYKIRGLMNMIGISNRIININSLENRPILLKRFSKHEIIKIKKFKKNSKKIINIFIKELKSV